MDATRTTSNALSLIGVYNLESAHNVEEYLKGLGVGLVLRKVQAVTRPNCLISCQPAANQWTVVTESVFKTKEVTFKPQEKFEDETFDSRKCESVIEVLENGTVIKWSQVCEKGPDVETTISSTETGLSWILTSGDYWCQFKYRRGLPLHQMQNNVSYSN